MGHSTLLSEPLAIVASVIVGLVFYHLGVDLGLTPDSAFNTAAVGVLVSNWAVGLPINLFAADLLGAVLGRTLSPVLSGALVHYLA